MGTERKVYRKAGSTTSQKPAVAKPAPTKKPVAGGNKPFKKSGKIAPILLSVLAALYLFATAFCALKFNSLNPIRTGWGLLQVMGGKAPYCQVGDIPYKAYVATPENSKEALIAMMQAQGYEYEEAESLGDAFIFGKENTRLRIVLSGNESFTRWVFSKEVELPSLNSASSYSTPTSSTLEETA